MVFLRLQPYKQTIVAFKGNRKLSPWFLDHIRFFNGWDRLLTNWNYLLAQKSILSFMCRDLKIN